VAGAQADALRAFLGDIRGLRVLDVGTGTGRAALLLAREGATLVGVDASEEMLAVARRRAADEGVTVSFTRGDAHALDIPDRSFDAAVSLRVLMHAPDWRRCLAELCRVSRRLIVIDYPSSHSLAWLESVARRAGQAVGVRTEAYRVFSDRQIRDALTAAGFRVKAVHRQFVLPIALHKRLGSRHATESVERALERAGLLERFGSPVTLVAERCESS
jgi:ubiquinone/menaquinone biosynthesis C-methylase UbiE